jgi:ankyrin repeat protein
MIPSSPFLPPMHAYVHAEASSHEVPVTNDSPRDGLAYILARYDASHINDMRHGISVLGQAIQSGDEQAVALLLQAGASSWVSTDRTALVMAASLDNNDVLEAVLQFDEAVIDSRHLQRAWWAAIYAGHSDAADLISEHGETAGNLLARSDKVSPEFASEYRDMLSGIQQAHILIRNVEVIERLPMPQEDLVATPEDAAALVRIMSSANDTDPARQLSKALSLALSRPETATPAIVITLLGQGADPNVAEPDSGTFPLQRAAQLRRTDIARVLLDFGANPRQADVRGDTALHIAGMQSAHHTIRLLINAGAQHDEPNREGETAHSLYRKNFNVLLPESEAMDRLICWVLKTHPVEESFS